MRSRPGDQPVTVDGSRSTPSPPLTPPTQPGRLTRPTAPTPPGSTPASSSTSAPTDDPGEGQRCSTWLDVEPLCRGPEPRPDWVVTSQAALDTELGILKTGKEADVFLLERAVPDDPAPAGRDGGQALPRRGAPQLPPQRRLHRGPAHPELPGRAGRWPRRPRTGVPVAAGQWAWAEWEALSASGRPASRSPTRCRSTAPRSSWSWSRSTARRLRGWRRPARRRDLLGWYFEQLRDAMIDARPARASRTATSRRTTCSRPGSGWCSSTCRRSSTSSPTRPGWTS